MRVPVPAVARAARREAGPGEGWGEGRVVPGTLNGGAEGVGAGCRGTFSGGASGWVRGVPRDVQRRDREGGCGACAAARACRRVQRARQRRRRRDRDRRGRQERDRILVGERVGGGADAEMQAVVAGRQRADAVAGADSNPAADGGAPERQVGHAAVAAADGDGARAARHRAGVEDDARARGADPVAGRGREVGAAVRAGGERRRGRVVRSCAPPRLGPAAAIALLRRRRDGPGASGRRAPPRWRGRPGAR